MSAGKMDSGSQAAVANPLKALNEFGQSVWFDYIRRSMLATGELDRLIEEDGLRGVTSNPAIFEKAITGSKDYADQIALLEKQNVDAMFLYEQLAIQDIKDAADRLLRVYEKTKRRDGYVSLEVSPYLARDTKATISEARRLWKQVAKPNVMIKVPATPEGIPAIRALTGSGVSVNVTLIFSLQRYHEVMDAYLGGLEQLAGAGGKAGDVRSVASFFVSRVDTKVDAAIEQRLAALPAGDPARAELESLRGRAAVANARLAYAAFEQTFGAPRFAALRARGAHVQRPLWASTSTKNPAYRDVLYVEELIGPDTVNTIPPQTLVAFNDHGVVEERIRRDLPGARALFARLPQLGVPADALVDQLEEEGVQAFANSYDEVLAALESRVRGLGAHPGAQA